MDRSNRTASPPRLWTWITAALLFGAVPHALSATSAPSGTTPPSKQLYRRAAQLVEEVRGTDMTSGWSNAHLNGEVRELLRPDVDGVAYYEFDVEPEGYVIVSTGDHDYPIPHWSHEGDSPTERLDEQAGAGEITVYYKLDALAYAGEDVHGDRVATYGQQPMQIIGLDALRGRALSTLRKGTSASYDMQAWASWDDLKRGFTESYGLLTDALRDEAMDAWQVETEIAADGRGVPRGASYSVALPASLAKLRIHGPGACFVERERISGDVDRLALHIDEDAPTHEKLPFTVTLAYANGRSERLRFFVDGSAEPVDGSIHTAIGDTAPGAMGGWSPWTYYWAGYTSDQRKYYQFDISGCFSGCGATAWTMLIGWADNQAARGNTYWAPRNGLYRVNGGYGADAVAPSWQSSGIVNVQTEIRGHIDTFCSFGSGATFPADMDEVSDYFVNRSGTREWTHYNVLGISETRLREYARNSIRDRRTPAIIGTGWLTHYPLAWGYAWSSSSSFWGTSYSRWFYVNQGWGGSGDGWVSASTWFAGEIYP